MSEQGVLHKLADRINRLPLEFYIFLFIFFDRVFRLIILSHFIETTDVIEHYYYAIEKYSFFAVFLVIAVRLFELLVRRDWKRYGISSLFMCLLALTIVAATFAGYGKAFMYDYMNKLAVSEVIMLTVLFFNTTVHLNKKQSDLLLEICGKFFFWTVFVFSVLSLYLYYFGGGRPLILFGKTYLREELILMPFDEVGGRIRYYGLFNFPTTLGNRCYLAAVLGFHFLNKKRMHWIPAVLQFCMSFVLIMLASARAGLLCMIMIMLFVVYRLLRRKWTVRKTVLVMAGTFAGLFLLAVILNWEMITFLLGVLREYPAEFLQVFTSDRSYLWSRCIALFLAKPWTGYGYGYQIAEPNHTNAHNIFFNLIVWSGVFGPLFFLGGLISGIIACFKEKARCLENPFLVCLLLCVMIQANLDIAVLGDMRNPATYFFWLIFGFLVHGVMAEE